MFNVKRMKAVYLMLNTPNICLRVCWTNYTKACSYTEEWTDHHSSTPTQYLRCLEERSTCFTLWNQKKAFPISLYFSHYPLIWGMPFNQFSQLKYIPYKLEKSCFVCALAINHAKRPTRGSCENWSNSYHTTKSLLLTVTCQRRQRRWRARLEEIRQ